MKVTAGNIAAILAAVAGCLTAAQQFMAATGWERKAWNEENKRLDALETVRNRYEASLDLAFERLKRCEEERNGNTTPGGPN